MTLLSMSSCSSVDRASARCSGGHGFDSFRGLRIFLCPTLVSCWLIHLHSIIHLNLDECWQNVYHAAAWLFTLTSNNTNNIVKCYLLKILEEVKISKEMDRDTLINVARTSLRTKLHTELADLLTEVKW